MKTSKSQSRSSQPKAPTSIELVLKKINDITRNQFIIDFMLLIQGFNFVIHPQEAHKGIVQSLAIAIFFAAFGVLLGFAISRGFRRHNLRPILLAFVFMVLSVVIYLNATHLAPTFHYFIALTIVLSGFFNILSSYHLTKLTKLKHQLKTELTSSELKDETVQSVATTLQQTTKLEAERILSPTLALSGKIEKFRYRHIVINLFLMSIGIMMLFFRFWTNEVLIRISGGILIFSAIADLIALLWTHRESTFVKSLTHFRASSSKPKA